jgi:thioesterase domain-containing protein
VLTQFQAQFSTPASVTPASVTPVLAPVVPFQTQGHRPPLFCVPGSHGNLLFGHGLARHLGPTQPLYGLQELIGTPTLPTRLPEVAQHYIQAMRTLQPQGPYYLVGYSFGGIVAFEMAQQLLAQGQSVGLLALLDPSRPIAHNAFRAGIIKLAGGEPSRSLIALGLLSMVRHWETHRLRWDHLGQRQKLRYLATTGGELFNPSAWHAAQQHAVRVWGGDATRDGGGDQGPWGGGIGALPVSGQLSIQSLGNFMKYDRLATHYLPRPYAAPVQCFLSQEWYNDPANWGTWSQFVPAGLHLHPLSGTHLSLYQEPNIGQIAEQLRVILRQRT